MLPQYFLQRIWVYEMKTKTKAKANTNTDTDTRKGFTLIELLVVVTIFFILAGGAAVNFVRFNERQQVITAVENIKTFIRSAQRRAQVQDTPPLCNPLQAYRVYKQSNSVLRMAANCGQKGTNLSTSPVGEVRELTLPDGVIVSTNLDIRFWTLYGGVQIIGGTGQIVVVKGNQRYTFDVTDSGVITKGDWEE